MTRFRIFVAAVAATTASSCGSDRRDVGLQAPSQVPPEVRRAAKDALWMADMPLSEEQRKRECTEHETCAAGQATLGTPFQVFTIVPKALLSYDGEQSVRTMISTTNHWNYPVYVDGQYHTLLHVAQVEGGTWEVVGSGSYRLGLWWEEVVARYPASAGYLHTFIRIFQASTDLILLERDGKEEVFSSTSNRAEPVELEEVLDSLQRMVRGGLEQQ